jgi:hypothetical protein
VIALAALLPASARGELAGRGEVRLGLQRFDYAEYGAPGAASLDREAGWLPAVSGELELRDDRFFGRAAARLSLGTVTYRGQTQSLGDPSLAGLRLRSTTGTSFVSGELQGGVFVDGARRLAVFAAVGARRWTRDIHDATVVARDGSTVFVLGVSEIYSWFELQAGARFTVLERPWLAWDAEARVVRTAGAEVSVDLARAFGVEDTARMGLGARTGWRLATTFRHDVTPALFLAASLWAEGFAFGASGVAVFVDAGGTAHGIAEPRSETVMAGLDVGVGGRF